nr:MAG TPA: hypothetical protein [Caudoviricetes sp.]
MTSFHPIFLLTLQWFSNQGVTLGAGFRLCLRGCNANNGGQCGSSTLNVNNDVSNANGNIGAALNLNTRDSLIQGYRLLPCSR